MIAWRCRCSKARSRQYTGFGSGARVPGHRRAHLRIGQLPVLPVAPAPPTHSCPCAPVETTTGSPCSTAWGRPIRSSPGRPGRWYAPSPTRQVGLRPPRSVRPSPRPRADRGGVSSNCTTSPPGFSRKSGRVCISTRSPFAVPRRRRAGAGRDATGLAFEPPLRQLHGQAERTRRSSTQSDAGPRPASSVAAERPPQEVDHASTDTPSTICSGAPTLPPSPSPSHVGERHERRPRGHRHHHRVHAHADH